MMSVKAIIKDVFNETGRVMHDKKLNKEQVIEIKYKSDGINR